MSRVGPQNNLGGAYGKDIKARLHVHDIAQDERWYLPIESADVTYTLNGIPRLKCQIPIGKRVARLVRKTDHEGRSVVQFEDTLDDGGGDHVSHSTEWSQVFPNNAYMYELKLFVDWPRRETWSAPTDHQHCLFRGYLTSSQILEAHQTPTGKKRAIIGGVGTVGFLQQKSMMVNVDGGAMSAPRTGFGVNANGELHGGLVEEIGSGQMDINDLIKEAITEACEQCEGIDGHEMPAKHALAVVENMLDGVDWEFDMDGPAAQKKMGQIMLQHMTAKSGSIWSTLQSIAKYLNLGIVSGVNKLLIGPVVRPCRLSESDMLSLRRDQVKSVAVENTGDLKVSGVQILSGEVFKQMAFGVILKDDKEEDVQRVLADMHVRLPEDSFWTWNNPPGLIFMDSHGYQAPGGINRLNAKRWPWLSVSKDPRAAAGKVAHQVLMDRMFGQVRMHVNLPYIDDALPPTVVKVDDMHGFDKTGTYLGSQPRYNTREVFGMLYSVQIHIDSRSPSVETRLSLSHVMDEDMYYDLASDSNSHMVADRVMTEATADYATWESNSFDYPSEGSSGIPTGPTIS